MKSAETRLAELGAKIDDWQKQLDAKSDKLSADVKQQRAEIQRKLDDARLRFSNLQAKGSQAWEEAKTGMKQAIDDLEASWKRARAAMKSP